VGGAAAAEEEPRSEDHAHQRQAEPAGTSEANLRDAKAAVAQYLSTSESGVLVISGIYGRIKDPDEARTSILKGAGESERGHHRRTRQGLHSGRIGSDHHLPGADGGADGATSTLPMCAWADDDTNAAVALATP
jgi:hypothetical protein